ncbi:MAG: hypothetical protein H3C68_07600 [Deltaproteobacteria bacterium]|nr:hypothetical protein [Deltaproteobacteria bacterium]MBZ0220587.1 hypothetical protein [Deltaproteobacteria bacterium]
MCRNVLAFLSMFFLVFAVSQYANTAEEPKMIREDPIHNMDALMETADRLWKDTSLGTAGVSCSTCHPDGKDLRAEPYPRRIEMANDILTLDQMINFCMTFPMKGEPLRWNSREMTALAAYVKAYAKGNGGK